MNRNLPTDADPGSIRHRILVLLAQNPDRQFRPASIAQRLGEDRNTVTSILAKMVNQYGDPVLRPTDGFYQFLGDLVDAARVEDPPTELHGIQILHLPPDTSKQGRAPRGAVELSDDPMLTGAEINEENSQEIRSQVWRGRRVTLSRTRSSGSLLVSLGAQDDPLSPEEFLEFRRWIPPFAEGAGWPVWDEEKAILRKIEFNRDYERVQMRQGEITVGDFSKVWIHAYSREDDVFRLEMGADVQVDLSSAGGAFKRLFKNLRMEAEQIDNGPGDPPEGMFG